MAKKKAAAEAEPKEDYKATVKDILAGLHEEFGEDIFVSGDAIVARNRNVVPFSPKMDMMLGGGILEGEIVVCTGPPKVGKEQPIYSIVYTPDGPKTMGELKIGDEVCTPDGGSAPIVAIYDNGLKDVYRIHFADGDYVDCGLEHLWSVKSRWTEQKETKLDKHYPNQIRTTQQLIQDGLFVDNGSRPKWAIDIPQYCHFTKQSVEIDPYVLGVLIGDGSFRDKVSLCGIDTEIIDNVRAYLDSGYFLTQNGISYTISHGNIGGCIPNKYHAVIKQLGLWNKKSCDKFIPQHYKLNSREIRLSILQGLMDTDGTIDKNGNISFCSTSHTLANDVKMIVQSLGGLASIMHKQTSWTYQGVKKYGMAYAVYIRLAEPLFRLTRKLNRVKTRSKRPLKRRVIKIEYLYKHECRCIAIDHPSHLYLTDNFVVTHNTSACLHFAGIAQQPENDSVHGPRHVFFHNIEMRLGGRDLEGIHHLDTSPERFTALESTSNNFLTAEKHVRLFEKLVHAVPGAIFVFDSFSALCTQTRLDSNLGDKFRDSYTNLLSDMLIRTRPIITMNGSIVLGVTHVVANTGGGMGSNKSETGGVKIQYNADVKLRATHREAWKTGADENAVQIGQFVNWNCDWSGLGSPGTKCASLFRYGYGIDKETELIEVAGDLGIIKKAGAWYQFPDGQKAQGKEKAREILVNDPAMYKDLNHQYRVMMGYEK